MIERTVTPEKARELLDNQVANRTVSPPTVLRYVNEIVAGRWRASMLSPIVVDENGRLIDGQHRMHAVIRAGVPVSFMFHQSDVQTVDLAAEQRARTMADRLRIIDGVRGNANMIASCLRLCTSRLKTGPHTLQSAGMLCSTAEIRNTAAVLEAHGVDIEDAYQQARAIYAEQHARARMFFPAFLMYALIDGSTAAIADRMRGHLLALCSDSVNRTPSQTAARSRMLGTAKRMRHLGLYAILRSFNDQNLGRIIISTDHGVQVPDADGGLFQEIAA